MPTQTGAQLATRVRDYLAQPSNGDATRAFITDSMIYTWLSTAYRKALRFAGRKGVLFNVTRLESSAPGSSISVGTGVLAIKSVWYYDGTHRYELPRVVEDVGPGFVSSGAAAKYWRPTLSSTGTFAIDLYPGQTANKLEVYYIPDPSDIASATSLYFPANLDEVCVLEAAIKGCARDNQRNQVLEALLQDERVEAEEALRDLNVDSVVKNTDSVYPPGYDQGREYDSDIQALYGNAAIWWAP